MCRDDASVEEVDRGLSLTFLVLRLCLVQGAVSAPEFATLMQGSGALRGFSGWSSGGWH